MGVLNRRLVVVVALSIAVALGLVVARSVSGPDRRTVPVIQLDRGQVPPAPSPDLPPETEKTTPVVPPTVQGPPPASLSPPHLTPSAPPEPSTPSTPSTGDDDDDDGDDGPTGDDDGPDDDGGDDDDD